MKSEAQREACRKMATRFPLWTNDDGSTCAFSKSPLYEITRSAYRLEYKYGDPKLDGFYGPPGTWSVCERWWDHYLFARELYDAIGPRPSRWHNLHWKEIGFGFCPGNVEWGLKSGIFEERWPFTPIEPIRWGRAETCLCDWSLSMSCTCLTGCDLRYGKDPVETDDDDAVGGHMYARSRARHRATRKAG